VRPSPYLVEVPPGATHVDLREVIVPVLQALLKAQTGERVSRATAECALLDVSLWSPLTERMLKLDPSWIRRYLERAGWYVHSDYDYWQASNREDEMSVSFRAADSFSLKKRGVANSAEKLWVAFESIAKWERVTIEQALVNVEVSVSAVDRLAEIVK